MSNAPPEIPGYTIVRRLGEGGMSVVYLAMQQSLKRHVGMKVLRVPDGDVANIAERFIHEAETIAKLDHPNIVNIYDVGQTPDGSLYYTMTFLDHGDLCDYEYSGDSELIALAQTLCDGLAYAHEHDVVHRDIKPENILFDKFGNAQIADFGIALTRGNQRWTKEGQVVGSAFYMSPEQCMARAVDARSDIYSLGVMLYEILTGKPPFGIEDEVLIMIAHVTDPVPELPMAVRHWHPLLDRCLAKAPDDRYQTIQALRAALSQVPRSAMTRALTSWRVTAQMWFARWRKRLLIGAAATATAAAISMSVYFWWLVNQTPDQGEEQSARPQIQQEVATPASEPPVIEPDEVEPVAPAVSPGLSKSEALQLVDEGLALVRQDQLTQPEDDNAADRFVAVLDIYPDHTQALEGLSALSAQYRELITDALGRASYELAGEYAISLVQVWRRAGLTSDRYPLVAAGVLSAVTEAVAIEADRIDPASATAALEVARIIDPDAEQIPALVTLVAALPAAGDLLADNQGFTTLVVPRVLKRSNGAASVANYGFAISPHEISLAQYRHFIEQRNWPTSACRRRGEAPSTIRGKSWQEPGIEQDEDHPVTCVTWQDAVAYAEWLSARSGHLYRLPIGAEWLHAARIGHESDIACETGNVGGTETAHFIEETLSCTDEIVHTAPVGRFQPNRLGIYDLRGNVREWVWDCAETDTGFSNFLDKLNLKEADACARRAALGTSWLDGRGSSMLGMVDYVDATAARSYIGFRLVRDLAAERARSRLNQ